MLNKIFNPDNFVFRYLGRAFDLMVLSVLWLACSLPVFTAGAATAALYYAVVKCVRRDEGGTCRNFFHSFKENFAVGVPLTLLAAVLGVLLYWGAGVMLTLANERGGTMTAMYLAYLVALVVPLGVLCYAFPLLSRFTLKPLAVLSNSFRLALAHLPTTAVLVLLLTQTVELCRNTFYLFFLPLCLCPGLLALVFSFFLERVFRPITPPEEVTEKEDTPWYLK